MATGGRPLVTVVIPTHDRPHLLRQAVDSALAQTVEDLEVVVVDDASAEPVRLPAHPRLRTVRLATCGGNAAARNAGLAAAGGRWIACLDDDDLMLPHLVSSSLEAIERSPLPLPVAALSGVAVVARDGATREHRLPPTFPRGHHFALEPLPAGRSYLSKQTLVVETAVLRGIGGWDPAFRSRAVSELFFRLNPVCSLQGTDDITYLLRDHGGPRVSGDPFLRQASFTQLVEKHRALFDAHPRRFAELLVDHTVASLGQRQLAPATASLARAARRSPAATVRRAPQVLRAAARSVRPGASR